MKVLARRIACAALLLAPIASAGGAEEAEAPGVYRHNRFDYWELRERFPDLLEPNYLPFMAYRVSVPELRGIAAVAQRVAS